MNRRSLAAVLAIGALVVATGISPASAQESAMVALPGSYLTPGYGMPGTVAQVGGKLTFANLDVQRHDVQAVSMPGQYAPVQCTSATPEVCPEGTEQWCLPPDPTRPWDNREKLPDGQPNPDYNPLPFPPGTCPIFWSRLISVGTTTPVLGLQYLMSGQAYEFLCSIHRGMRGTLVAV